MLKELHLGHDEGSKRHRLLHDILREFNVSALLQIFSKFSHEILVDGLILLIELDFLQDLSAIVYEKK